MNKWIFLVCSLLLTNGLYAQFQTIFQKTYGGVNTSDFAEAVIETADGNFVFAGTTANFGAGGFDMYLVKTDSDGNEIWSQAYGTAANEVGVGVVELSDGSLVCVGNTNFLPSNPQIYAVKTDADGNEIWKTAVGDLNTSAADIAYTEDDGVVIAGDRNDDPYLLKIDADGVLQWDNTLGFGLITGLESVRQTSDEGFIVVVTELGDNGEEMVLIKTDEEGDFEWSSSIKESDNASRLEARDALQTLDGGYVTLAGIGGGFSAVFVHKTDELGEPIWTQIHTVLGDNIEPQRMVEMADSTLWVIGEGLLDDADEGTEIFALKLDKEGTLLFEERYSYGGYESGNDIIVTSSNEVLIAGTADSFNGSGNDMLSIHLTSMGEEISQQSYGGIGNADTDRSFGLLEIGDEGYLLGGHSDSFNERGDLDINLLRLSKNGEVMWSKNLDFFNGRDEAYNIVEANDGGLGIYGVSTDETGLRLPQLTRTDSEGNVLWTKRFELLLPVFTKAVSALADGGWVVSGRLLAGGVYIAKLDDMGEIVWENSYSGNVAYNVHPTSDGGYILAGRANFQQDPETNIIYTPLQVAKTDESGNLVWERLMGSSASLLSRAFDVTETISGGFVLVGGRTGETAATANLLIAKLGDSGNVLWEKEMLTEEYSFNNYVVEQTTDNGFIFIGNVGEPGDAQRRSFLLKTDGIGNEKWIRLFGEDVGTFPVFYDGLQTADGGYAMTGVVSVDNSVEMYFVKADELGFTEIVGIFSPSVRLLLQLAPNPNDGRFQMSFEGEHIGAVDLTIFDATGRQVFAHSGMKNSATHQEELDLSDLNSGVYILEVISGEKRYSQRLIIR